MCGHRIDELPPELDPWRNGLALRHYRETALRPNSLGALRQFCDRPNSLGALPTEPEPVRLSL